MTRYWFAASSEEFTPTQMIEQLRAAEAAGFEGLAASDHFAPWWPDGQASQSWMVLAAAGQHTRGPLGTSVTPVLHHYHPAVVAQAWVALADLYPGRVYLGVGSGEAVNEVPTGIGDWPEPAEKLERFDQGLEAITRLWAGETVTMDAGWFSLKEAKLYTRAAERPKLYVSAFGPQAAAIAGKHGDGLWSLGDPDAAPEVIEAYRKACSDHGREPGEIILQSGFCLHDDEQAAIDATRKWKATQLDDSYLRDLHDPASMLERADREVSDEEFAKEGFIVSSDPGFHVERIRAIAELGATVVCLQGIGDLDPIGSIERYGREVLPELRG